MFQDIFPIDQPDHWLVTWGFAGEDFDVLRTYADEVSYPARATNLFRRRSFGRHVSGAG